MSKDVEALIYGEVDRDETSHISYYESVFCCHPESALMQRILFGELHCFKGREPLSEMGSWNLRVLYALNGLGDPMSPLLGDREMRRALRRPLAAETIERFRSTGFAMIDKGVAGGVEVENEV